MVIAWSEIAYAKGSVVRSYGARCGRGRIQWEGRESTTLMPGCCESAVVFGKLAMEINSTCRLQSS